MSMKNHKIFRFVYNGTRKKWIHCNSYSSISLSLPPSVEYASQSRRIPYQESHYDERNIRRSNQTISLLSRCGRLIEARKVFNDMTARNVVTWNSMIKGYLRQGKIIDARNLFDEMPERDIVSWNLMISGYVLCRGSDQMEEGKKLFYQMPERDSVSWNTMISGYAKNGKMECAQNLFDRMPERNVIAWNALIAGYLQSGEVKHAIEIFDRMPRRDSASLSVLVSGLIRNDQLEEASQVLMKNCIVGNEGIVDAFNTVIAGYGQKGNIKEARKLFEQLGSISVSERKEFDNDKTVCGLKRNIVSWNIMIMSYIKVGDLITARQFFDAMPARDSISWNTMINGYVHASDLNEADFLFHQMPIPDAYTWNFMISGFAQKGDLHRAIEFFNQMPEKKLVSWNSIIAGCEHNGNHTLAIEFFLQMLASNFTPDSHTLSSVISACAGLVSLHGGMQMHQCIIKCIVPDIPINNSLITMYSRCGSIKDARFIFNEMRTHKDVVSWNAMIGGYAHHGFANEALDLFRQMKKLKVKPTHITFISVLNACDHAGLVVEAKRYFNSMTDEFGISPSLEHYASLIDVVGRHGNLKEAIEVIDNMFIPPDKIIWSALLNACKLHNDIELARLSARKLMEIDPETSLPYVQLYNMYADAGNWEEALEVRKEMEMNGVRKQPGYSWIELHGRFCVFVSGDRVHPQADEIHSLIDNFDKITKDLDYLDILDDTSFRVFTEKKSN